MARVETEDSEKNARKRKMHCCNGEKPREKGNPQKTMIDNRGK